jgi:hypothetical protein
MLHARRHALVTLLLAAAAVPTAKAQTARRKYPPAAAYHIGAATGPIVIDGVLDEPAWAAATRIPVPYEWLPGDNVPSPVETDCRVTYDPGSVYIACRALDSKPSAIRAHFADRDDWDRIPADDHIAVYIDPFNDNRRAFEFRINPLGVQMDALVAPADSVEDFSWDAIWESKGRVGDDGYVVEVRIPFRSLRFPAQSGEQTWGVSLERSWPRSARHRMRSAPWDRGNACKLCQANRFTGFEGITAGSNVELIPTLTSRRVDQRAAFPEGPLESGKVKADPGLDLRWGVTPNLSLNGTVNPDFSQVEADVAQLDVNARFALYFPERRPFFLEGSDLFTTPIQAVFTRTVADPTGGLKLTGKWGGTAGGVFAAHDQVTNLLFPSNQGTADTSLATNTVTTALRYRRDVGGSSTVGLLYAGREGADGYANRVVGADANLLLHRTGALRLQALVSQTGYSDAIAQRFGQPRGRFAGTGLRAAYTYTTRKWLGFLALDELSPEFRADAGFIPRVDLRAATGMLTRTIWGGAGSPFTQLQFGVTGNAKTDHQWTLTDRSAGVNAMYLGPAQTSVLLEGFRDYQRLAGVGHDLTWGRVSLQSQPWGSAKLWLTVRAGDEVDVVNNRTGSVVAVTPTAQLYFGRALNVNLQHDYQRLRFGGGRVFTANLLQARVLYHLNTRTFVRVIVHWEHVDREPARYVVAVPATSQSVFTQLLFSYKLNPQTVAFLGYSDASLGTEVVDLTRLNRTFFIKLGYALRP